MMNHHNIVYVYGTAGFNLSSVFNSPSFLLPDVDNDKSLTGLEEQKEWTRNEINLHDDCANRIRLPQFWDPAEQ